MFDTIMCVAFWTFIVAGLIALVEMIYSSNKLLDKIIGLAGLIGMLLLFVGYSMYSESAEYRYKKVIECEEILEDKMGYLKEPFLTIGE